MTCQWIQRKQKHLCPSVVRQAFCASPASLCLLSACSRVSIQSIDGERLSAPTHNGGGVSAGFRHLRQTTQSSTRREQTTKLTAVLQKFGKQKHQNKVLNHHPRHGWMYRAQIRVVHVASRSPQEHVLQRLCAGSALRPPRSCELLCSFQRQHNFPACVPATPQRSPVQQVSISHYSFVVKCGNSSDF